MSERARSSLFSLLPGALVLVVFGATMAGGFAWDDTPLIVDDVRFADPARWSEIVFGDFWDVGHAGGALRAGYFRPVVKGAWVVAWWLGNGAAWPFHALNVGLHAVSALLAAGFVRRRLGDREGADVAAVLAACVFAVHPSRAESVGWICGATDLWLGLFVLLAAWAWDVVPGRAGLVLASVFAIGAVFSKESALLLAVVFAVDGRVLDRSKLAVRGLVDVVVLGAVMLAAFGARLGVVAAPKSEGPGPLWEAAARVFATVGYYVKSALLPLPPSALSGATGLDASGRPLVPGAWVVVGIVATLVVIGAAVLAWRSGRRAVIGDLAWLVVFLAPVLNAVPLGYLMLGSERFLYVPLLGLVALFSRGLLAWSDASEAGAKRGRAISGLLVLTCAALVFPHALEFGDDAVLWTSERETHPDDAYAADQLARALDARNDPAAALPHADFAATHFPDGPSRLRAIALAYELRATLATTPAELSDVDRFCTMARTTTVPIRAELQGIPYTWDPAHAAAVVRAPGYRSACATVSARLGHLDDAIAQFLAWRADEPGRFSIHANLVHALHDAGRDDDARRARDEAAARFTDPAARAALDAILAGSPK